MQIYTTFNGERKEFSKLDHQHLSNIWWYNTILNSKVNDFGHYLEKNISIFKSEIDNRFGGIVLPYLPRLDFKLEIEMLEKGGFLRWITDSDGLRKRVVIYEGKEIGEIVLPEDRRDFLIKKVLDEK